MMKQIITAVLLLIAAMTRAQVNLLPGYIITNEGDTIRGTIDYRSDARNAALCLFRADGGLDFKEYAPGQIQGYRLQDTGVYYVTQTFPVDNVKKTFFAEFLLQGGVSLFHHRETGCSYYYFVDSNGTVATLKAATPTATSAKERQAAVMEVARMFSKSPQTVQKLWKTDFYSSSLTRLVKEYDEEYCTEAGDCIQFEYDARRARAISARFFVQAGIKTGRVEARGSYYTQTFSGTAPQIGMGLTLGFPRFTKALTVQAAALFSSWSLSEPTPVHGYHFTEELKFKDIEIQLGGMYRFLPDGKVSPFVKAGILTDLITGIKGAHIENYYVGHNISRGTGFGIYAGAGADISLAGTTLRASAGYSLSDIGKAELRMNCLTVNIGVEL